MCGTAAAHAHGKVQLSTLFGGVVAGSIQRLCVPTISLHRRPLDGWPGFRRAGCCAVCPAPVVGGVAAAAVALAVV